MYTGIETDGFVDRVNVLIVSIMCPVSVYLHGVANGMFSTAVMYAAFNPETICCSFSFLLSALDSPTATVSPVESTSDYQNGSDISLQCSWNTSVYYVAWYKNGMLFYLAASTVLMGPPQGINIGNDFTMMSSNLTIVSAALDDSGNYTCAVTCGAKGVEFGMIAGNLTDTAEVFVYGE